MAHSVVLIGNARRREFSAFVTWLCDQPELKIAAHYATPAEALTAGSDEGASSPSVVSVQEADLTIVLQSWSDEFAADEVNQLVGATLFRRLLCCYGPWCESDGRNRDTWPDANRVPLRIARRIVEWEMLRISRDEPAVPPTSARDEIFDYRLGEPEDWAPLPDALNRAALVVSPDRVLRETVALLLEEFGLRPQVSPLLDDLVDLTQTHEELDHASSPLILHDLDPWGERVAASLVRVRRACPSADVLGIASMPDAGLQSEIADVDLPFVIPRLDLDDSLRWILHERGVPASPRARRRRV